MSTATGLNPVRLDSNLAPQFVNIKQEPRSFVFLNSKAKPCEVMCNGNLMTVPPRNTVGPHSDTDSEGVPIPGTYVFQDRFAFNPVTGEEDLIFDAKFAARLILGIQPGPGGAVASSRYAQGGLSLLPRHCDPEVWKAAAEAGEARSYAVELDNARNLLLEFEDRTAKARAASLAPPPLTRDYQRARFLVEKAEELEKKEIEAEVSPHLEDAVDAEIEILAIARAKAMVLVEKAAAGKNIDKMALLNELLNEPALRVAAQKEWSIRRRGHLPVQKEMLEVAAAAGVGVSEAGLEDEREVVK